ncbi:MAG TPA: hypothetical protein VL550_07060 [Rhodocyclaceae bacterium]|jgi:hypothetical protein|nr:hypothetical protein [Rhodocyclaceae bacterium]
MKKRIVSLLAVATLSLAASAANAQISVSVGEPGFYGAIDVGGYPPPPLVYSRPVVAVPGAYAGPPIYLHAPALHMREWDRYCARYGACGRPVYFVQDNWYNSVYVPRYHGRPYGPPPRRYGPPPHHDHRDDHRDDHHDHDRRDWH